MEPRKFFWPMSAIYSTAAGIMQEGYAYFARRADLPPRARTLLDVAGGDGRLAVAFAGEYPQLERIVCSDITESMVSRARKRAAAGGLQDRVSAEKQDAQALTYKDASFDCVVSTGAMHHWPDPARALSEMGRVLKPGGRFFLFDNFGRPSLKQIRKDTVEVGGNWVVSFFLWIGSKDALPLTQIEQAVKDSGVGYISIVIEGARLFIQGTKPGESG